MKLTVKYKKISIKLELKEDVTLGDFKVLLGNEFNANPSLIRVLAKSKPIIGNSIMKDYGITDNETLTILIANVFSFLYIRSVNLKENMKKI